MKKGDVTAVALVVVSVLCAAACASRQATVPNTNAERGAPRPTVSSNGAGRASSEKSPKTTTLLPEDSTWPADCASWGSTRGRRPHFPAKRCAGPAADPHTTQSDVDALKKLEVAIGSHFLAFGFERTLDYVLGISDACEDRCSPEVQARLWMYAGTVLESGLSLARCAFEVALAWDPKVVLDEQLSTPAVKAAFLTARRNVCRE